MSVAIDPPDLTTAHYLLTEGVSVGYFGMVFTLHKVFKVL